MLLLHQPLNMDDTYKTIAAKSEGTYSQLRSKFLAFAAPVRTAEEALAFVAEIQKKYYDARHCCYAYMLGAARETFRANDNGEPSGTAGKPILGQINSNGLTNIVIAVVRYFGGIKLGTSGLIQAYRAAAAEAIASAEIVEKTVDISVSISFDYLLMNDVMRIVKEEQPEVLGQDFGSVCTMTLSQRSSLMPRLRARLENLREVTIADNPA